MGAKDAVLERLLESSAQFSDEQVAQTVELLLAHGIEHNATDIHIEPHDRSVVVRYRIDGILQTMHKLPSAARSPMAAHLKALAGLDTEETRLPQRGSFVITVKGETADVSLSIMPVIGGEHIVLHLSSQNTGVQSLAELGLWGHSLAVTQTALTRPQGLILVAGPKRAGTAATLLSLTATLNRPSISTITLEEKIIARVPGITQTEVHSTIPDALRAALHHDPNVIMMHDMPDQASIELAMQAANAGHVVLAGMHAQNAAQALLRMRAAGISSFSLGLALQLAIAQAQVPRLCAQCRVRHALTDGERTALEARFGIATASARKRVHELERQAIAADLGSGLPLSTTMHGITHVWRAKSGGCEICHHRGARGQVLLSEIVAPTEHVRDALSKHPTESSLQAAAVKDGAVMIGLDGLIKALRGLAAIEDVAPIV